MAIENVNAAASDPYAPFKEAIKAGKVVQFYGVSGEWRDGYQLAYSYPPDRYRIKPEEPAKAPEPAKELMDAYAQAVVHGTGVVRVSVTSKPGGDSEVKWTPVDAAEMRRPSDGPEMAIPEPQFPYNIATEPPSSAHPACAGLMRVWADPCWAKR